MRSRLAVFYWFILWGSGIILAGCEANVFQPAAQDVPPAEPTQVVSTVGTILLDPFAGEVGRVVTVRGQGWPAGSQVLVEMILGGAEYRLALTTADADGQFTTNFVVPDNPDLKTQRIVSIVASIVGSDVAAEAFFNVVHRPPAETELAIEPTDTLTPTPTSTSTATATSLPTPTSTQAPTPTPTPSPVPTPTPLQPRGIVSAIVLHVRSGPGVAYPVLGTVVASQSIEINGRSDGWWRIQFPSLFGDFGWVSGNYIEAQNTGEVPLVQPPPTPIPTPTFTPTATPTKILICNPGEWTGCGGRPPAITCLSEYVSQCTAAGLWGQCTWDPATCGGGDYDTFDDDDDDNDDDN